MSALEEREREREKEVILMNGILLVDRDRQCNNGGGRVILQISWLVDKFHFSENDLCFGDHNT